MKAEIKQLKSALGKRNRKIAALKKVNGDGKDEDADEVEDDAGNAFGGKKSKKQKKE